ncbi:MAG TPA: NlpC/P60 family protein, partial [Chitinispirillaceae bacterium]|nr:NlpC/P60 family protein [Chitinispirillaceae bacterium]
GDKSGPVIGDPEQPGGTVDVDLSSRKSKNDESKKGPQFKNAQNNSASNDMGWLFMPAGYTAPSGLSFGELGFIENSGPDVLLGEPTVRTMSSYERAVMLYYSPSSQIPYVSGGTSRTGMDCSGLFCAVNLGEGNRNGLYVQNENFPPGNWYQTTWDDRQTGDAFVWRNPKFGAPHAAFYAGGARIFHSSSSRGVGFTSDLYRWWIPNRGIPEVWREQ